MCGGTTHPRMTMAPKLTLGAMTSAVTTAELSTLLKLRRISFFAYPPCRGAKSPPDQSLYILCAASLKRLSDPDLGVNQRNRERYICG